MKRITFFSTPARRWLAAAVLLFVALLPAMAKNTPTYYYRAYAYVSPENNPARGKVYIKENDHTEPSTNDYKTSTQRNPHYKDGSLQTDAEQGSARLYFWAQAANGWVFDHWSPTNDPSTTSISNPYIVDIKFNSEDQNRRTPFSYTAYFVRQTGVVKARVAANDEGKGSVRISNANNTSDTEEVTIKAIPDASNGISFLGWTKDNENSTEYIPDAGSEYTISIKNHPNNEGTYYAHFSDAPEQLYCRIRNRHTKRFLTIYGNSVAEHKRKFGDEDVQDGFDFTNSLKMTSTSDEGEAIGNPMTVFLRESNSVDHYIAKNVKLKACDIYVDQLTKIGNTSYLLTMEENPETGAVRIYTNMSANVSGQNLNFKSYLQDEGGDKKFAVMKSADDLTDESLDWDVYVLDENCTEGSFGAYAKSDFSGNDTYGKKNRYYTTMYTYFPYKLMDGVRAYYLLNDKESYTVEDKTVHFTEITSGIVPKNSAVVLECLDVYDETNYTSNRLRPLTNKDFTDLKVNEPDPLSFPKDNFLNGYISLYDKTKNGSEENPNPNKVTNNKSSMFILSKVDGDLGWFYFTAKYMTPNKAFLDLRPWENLVEQNRSLAREIKFVFGKGDDDEATGVIAPKYADQVEGPLFDLNGRRVTDGDAYSLKKGIYITNGKKIVVK